MYGRRMSRRSSNKLARRGARFHVKNLSKGASYMMRGGERLS